MFNRTRLTILFIVLAVSPGLAVRTVPPSGSAGRGLFFEQNLGQLARGDFAARGLGYGISFDKGGLHLRLGQRGSGRAHTDVGLSLVLVDAAPSTAQGLDRQTGHSNYYVGDRSRWRTAVPHFSRVRYRNVYDGIDVVYYGTSEHELEYDFIVAPGADPSRIRLTFDGASSVQITSGGDLAMAVADAVIVQRAPVTYQLRDGRRSRVASRYVLSGDVISFEIGAYDKSEPLIIDPVLSYSTFFGGSREEMPQDVFLGKFGNPIVVGRATSPDIAASPVVPYIAPEPSGDVFILSLDPDGHAVRFVTYFGGTGDDWPQGSSIDHDGNIVVGMGSQSPDIGTTANAVQRNWPCNQSCVYVGMLAKFGGSGELLWSTFLSSEMWTSIQAVGIGSTNEIYVAGRGSVAGYPVVSPFFQPILAEGNFATKVSPAGDQILWSSFIDDAGSELYLANMTIDSVGRPVLLLDSYAPGVATSHGPPHAGDGDVLIMRLFANGTGIDRSTYFGGSGFDGVHAAASASDGGIWLAGATRSLDLPVVAPLRPPSPPNESGSQEADNYVAKFSEQLVPTFATHWGGTGPESVSGMVVEATGAVVVVGQTGSLDFPEVRPLMSPGPSCVQGGDCWVSHGFVTRFKGDGSAATFSSRVGRTASVEFDFQHVSAVAPGLGGSLWLAGLTSNATPSTANNFPVTSDALWPTPRNTGRSTPYLLRIDAGAAPTNSAPVARAGADFTRAAGPACVAAVSLDGSASSDTDGDSLSYTWTRAGVPQGSTAVLARTLGVGTHTFVLTIDDGYGHVESDDVVVTISDLTSPALTVPAPLTIEQTGPTGASFTPPPASAVDNCSATPVVTVEPGAGWFPPGATTVTYTASDEAENAVSATTVVTVRDSVAPVIASVTPSLASLSPANHQMVAVNFLANATDAAGPAMCRITSVASNEPINGLGDGDTAPDWSFSGLSAQLRAERSGAASGRIYTVTIACADVAGNVATKSAIVRVPHSRGR